MNMGNELITSFFSRLLAGIASVIFLVFIYIATSFYIDQISKGTGYYGILIVLFSVYLEIAFLFYALAGNRGLRIITPNWRFINISNFITGFFSRLLAGMMGVMLISITDSHNAYTVYLGALFLLYAIVGNKWFR